MKRLIVLCAALVAVFALGGCALMPQTAKQLPDSKVLPPAGNEALKSIVLAKAGFDAAYDYIGASVTQELLDPKQGRIWYNTLDTYKAKLKQADGFLAAGDYSAAKLQAEGTKALIKVIHDAAVEAVKAQNIRRGSGAVLLYEPQHRVIFWGFGV
jgi:hypothetical protein